MLVASASVTMATDYGDPPPGQASGRLAIVAGTILTVTSGEISPGVLLIHDGKIAAVQAGTTTPPGYEVLDAANCVVLPGLVDAHTHLGLRDVPAIPETLEFNENTKPFTAELRVEDSIDPTNHAFRTALSRGTTTAVVLPGSSNLIGGLGIVVKTAGDNLEAMTIDAPRILKAALGMNPKSAYGRKSRSPKTRMAAAAMLRERFEAARRYVKERDRGDSDEIDVELEPLARAIAGQVHVHFHAARADDLLTVLSIVEEFGLHASIGHAYEGYLIAEELARSGVPVVLGPKLAGWFRGVPPDAPINVAGSMIAAGVDVSLMTDGYVDDLFLQAAYAIRLGLPSDDALRAITINPARLIGLEDRIGSLDPGKDADIVILDGRPFDPRTRVVKVLIEGEVVFETNSFP